MLSIKNIESSAAAVSYFEKDDYYAGGVEGSDGSEQEAGAEGERASGYWFGKAAAAAGLVGGVDRDQFRDVLDGKLPDGTQLGTITEKGGEKVHLPGWDMTFSAPKSVSILAEIGADDRLLAAHDEAVKVSVEWFEKNVATYRKRGLLDARERPSDSLLVALFQHHTSRNEDPQLHTHAVVANATLDGGGKWVSLHSKPLYNHKMVGGNIYRAELAKRVQKLGYEIERINRDGRWEIKGVDEKVREVFSTRSADIKALMEEKGLEGAAASGVAAVLTREAKRNVSKSELIEGWRQRAEAAGFDAVAAADTARQAGDVTPAKPAPLARAVRESVDRLSDSESVFSHAELIRWSLAGSMGSAGVKEIEDAIYVGIEPNSLMRSRLDERTAWTTEKAKNSETRVLKTWRDGQATVPSAYKPAELADKLEGTLLKPGQRAAVELMLTTKDRFIGILGRPGVGKTYMLGEARQLFESRGFVVKGMAANSEAARIIQQDTGIKSFTLQKHLQSLRPDIAAYKAGSTAEKKAIRERYAKEVWVVDEASQVGTRMMRMAVLNASMLGARMVIQGDTKQLAAIGAGKPMDLMLKDGMKHVEINDIIRQKDELQLKAIRATIAGEIPTAMALLEEHTTKIQDREKRLGAIVAKWRSMGDARAATSVLTSRNEEREQLNARMRDVLRGEGKLAGEMPTRSLQRVFAGRMDKVEAELYQPGDLVRFGRKSEALGIASREYLIVQGVDKETNEIRLGRMPGAEGGDVVWNPRERAGSARNGVELFRPTDTTLAPGERIQWSDNNLPRGLANGQILTVVGVASDHINVETGERKLLKIDTTRPDGGHWSHAYAKTVYKAQGSTDDHVILNAESTQAKLFTQKALLVGISRQKLSLTIFTDDPKALTANVAKHLGDKTSAREQNTEYRLDAARQALEAQYQDMIASMPKVKAPKTPAPEQPRAR